jgi:hypothetical protein
VKTRDIYGRTTVQYGGNCMSQRKIYKWMERSERWQYNIDVAYIGRLATKFMLRLRCKSICKYIRENRGIMLILSRVSVTIDGFRLVSGFIDHLRVVTINKYKSVADFHTTNHSTLNLLFAFTSLRSIPLNLRFLATDFNTRTITVTLQISLYYSTR